MYKYGSSGVNHHDLGLSGLQELTMSGQSAKSAKWKSLREIIHGKG